MVPPPFLQGGVFGPSILVLVHDEEVPSHICASHSSYVAQPDAPSENRVGIPLTLPDHARSVEVLFRIAPLGEANSKEQSRGGSTRMDCRSSYAAARNTSSSWEMYTTLGVTVRALS